MVLGGVLGAGGAVLPGVEPAILASVVVLGAAAAFAVRAPLGVACAVIAAFGMAHGTAHGLEAPALGGAGYGLGFLLSTAALHLAGLAVWGGAAAGGGAGAGRGGRGRRRRADAGVRAAR